MASSILHNSGGQDLDRIRGGLSHVSGSHMNSDSPSNAGDDGLDITAGQKIASAMSGSLLTSLLVTPLDVVRVRMQSQQVSQPVAVAARRPFAASGPAATAATFTASSSPSLGVTACCREVFFVTNTADYCLVQPRAAKATAAADAVAGVACGVREIEQHAIRSTLDGLRKIARNEGVATLWRGLSPTLVMTIPGNIIYFTGYDWLRSSPRSPFAGAGDGYAPLVAGASARALAAFSINPIELFRTRMQATPGSSVVPSAGYMRATFRGVQDMVRERGFTSLWRGLALTLWRDVPFSGIYWWSYETVRGRLNRLREAGRSGSGSTRSRGRPGGPENHTDTFVDSFAAGALSGACASIVTMPFDVGKTRTQVFREAPGPAGRAAGAAGAAGATAPEQKSMLRLLRHIFETEGLRGLWRGWIPRTLKVAPACAIMISSYEVGKRAFRGVNERARAGTAGGDGKGLM